MTAGSLAVPRRPLPGPPLERVPPVGNARLAIIVVIVGECMLFAGLVGTYLVFRLAARHWPPPDLPRLPLGLTAANSVVLLASAPLLWSAVRAVRAGRPGDAPRRVAAAAALGAVFLAIQGVEWARLVGHGLTLGGSVYGATFYTLIGCHAVHVLVALAWLAVVAALATRGAFTAERHAALEVCATYWYFVCGLWVVLFPLVYLW
jgi:heme/copper-type cytochrome/quinol oxidase subunit 3